MNLYMSAGRDYRSASGYEYCLFDRDGGDAGDEDGKLVARAGGFSNNAAAKRAGAKKAAALYAADPQKELL